MEGELEGMGKGYREISGLDGGGGRGDGKRGYSKKRIRSRTGQSDA